MIDEPDYYALLGVSPDADAEELRLAYRVLARRYHPDIAGTGDLERMQRINRAYTVLSDPDAREAYHLKRGLPLPSAPAQPEGPREGTPPRRASGSSTGTASGAAARPPARPSAGASSPRPSPTGARPARPSAPCPTATRTAGGPFQRVAVLAATTGPAAALSLTADGERLGVGALDGSISLWAVRSCERVTLLSDGAEQRAGVLQGLRLSPSGSLAVAWGFMLGISVWQVAERRRLWSTPMSAPRGLLDAALRDDPHFVRLALPAAPEALAEVDPFRWANDGRRGTALVTRPLAGPVTPSALQPVLCWEDRTQRPKSEEEGWRVRERILSADGQRLLTFASAREPKAPNGRMLSLWDTEHRAPLIGTPSPRRIAHQLEREALLDFPLAATPDLEWVALGDGGDALSVRGLRERARLRVVVGSIPEDARLALSPDARSVALARDNLLDVFDPRAGERCQRWEFPAEVSALLFGAENLLAVGLGNGQVEVWQAR